MASEKPLKKSGATSLPRQFLTTDLLIAGGLDIEGLATHKIFRVGSDIFLLDPSILSQFPSGAKLKEVFDAEFENFDPMTSGLTSLFTGPAIRELSQKSAVSASPGFSFGRSGNTPSGTWLLRTGSVPSNKTGLPVGLIGPNIDKINVGNEEISTFDVEVYEHEGDEVNLTLLHTVNVVAARTGTFSVNVPVTSGRQLACKISTGSAKNPGVDFQLSGSVS